MLKASIAGLLTHKLRLALTAFAIVLGVSFVVATLVLSNGLQKTFDGIFSSQQTGIAVVVRGHAETGGENGGFGAAHRPVPSSLLTTVQTVNGVSVAEGVLFRAGATLLDPKTGQPFYPQGGPPEFATNWIKSSVLSPYHLQSGTPPSRPDEVVVDAGTAKAHHLGVGQTVVYVINGGQQQRFTISGIARYGNSDTLAGATISLFTLDTTQRLLHLEGKFDQIDVGAASGVGATELRDRISRQLPAYAEAATEAEVLGEQTQGIDQFFSILRTILLVFALIALFVGSYIIVNTFSILIAQRTRELALLRILGASRGQVFRMVLFEALLTGLAASALGCLAGLLLSRVLYSALKSLGGGLPAADLTLDWRTAIVGIALGTGVTLAAAIFPSRKASRVAPVEAIREVGEIVATAGARRVASGAILILAGIVLVGVGLFSGISFGLQLFGAGAFVLALGASLLAPLVVLPVAGTLGLPIQTLRGAPGKLARLNAIRAPRRAAATASGLMIGVTLVVGIAVLVDSVKTSTAVAVKESLKADYLVLPAGGGGGGRIDPGTAKALSKDPHFSQVEDITAGTVLINNASTSVFALDPAVYSQLLNIDAASGNPSSIGQANTILVDQQQANDHNWKVGDTIPIYFPQVDKTVKQTVGCIFNSNAILSGYIISAQTYARNFPEASGFILLLRAAPGVSHAEGLAALNRDLKAYPTLKAYDSAAFLALQSKGLDQFAAAIDVFLAMAIIIAALGIVNTLALSIIERTREIGLLRAIGLSRQQTRTMVRWESVLVAFIGLVLGLILGIALGIAVVHALGSTGISHVSLPWDNLVIYAIGVFIIGLVAAIFPARRAARMNILEAIASE